MTDTLNALSIKQRAKDHVDYGLLVGLVALSVVGVIMAYSATRQQLVDAGENPHYYFERQAMFVVLGLVVMVVVARIDYRRYEIVATPLYVFSLLALAGVFVVGTSAFGAQIGRAHV